MQIVAPRIEDEQRYLRVLERLQHTEDALRSPKGLPPKTKIGPGGNVSDVYSNQSPLKQPSRIVFLLGGLSSKYQTTHLPQSLGWTRKANSFTAITFTMSAARVIHCTRAFLLKPTAQKRTCTGLEHIFERFFLQFEGTKLPFVGVFMEG